MDQELLNQALTLFNTPEKWNAYVEFAVQKDVLRDYYFKQLKQPLWKYFNENPIDPWICEPWGDQTCDLKWYIKDFGVNSLVLLTGWKFEFHLYLSDLTNFDTNKINELLKTDYARLLTAFDRIDRQYEPNTKAMECRNYSFGSPFDGKFNTWPLVDKLAWFAGHETESFAKQIIDKIERFRQNKELTTMLFELNERSRNNPNQ